MKMLVSLAVVVLVSVGIPRAEAEPLIKWQNEANTQSCAETFPVRLANFREGIMEQQAYTAEYNRVMPWFDQHCRWLTGIEIAIRKIDESSSFVCDTKKGRPKELTTDFALEHASPADAPTFIEYSTENRWCSSFDAAQAVSLELNQVDESHVQARTVLTAMCWNVQSAKCDKARAALAATP